MKIDLFCSRKIDWVLRTLFLTVKELLDSGFAGEYIEKNLIPQLGYDLGTIPQEVQNLLRANYE